MAGGARLSMEESRTQAMLQAFLSDLAHLDCATIEQLLGRWRGDLPAPEEAEEADEYEYAPARGNVVVAAAARAFCDRGAAAVLSPKITLAKLHQRLMDETPADLPPQEPVKAAVDPREPLRATTAFDLDELGGAKPPNHPLLRGELDEARRALALLDRVDGALVKTIRNESWRTFCMQLHLGEKTATTVPPAGCVGMRLFGRVWAHSCGVVFDRAKLDLADVWCWPSGFFAKTEFGVKRAPSLLPAASSKEGEHEARDDDDDDDDSGGRTPLRRAPSSLGRRNSRNNNVFSSDEDEGEKRALTTDGLSADLRRNLTTVKELERMAAAREYAHFGAVHRADVVPYNEAFAPVHNDAVVAVFARSNELQHILFAMAARDLLMQDRRAEYDDGGEDEAPRIAVLVLEAGGGRKAEVVTPAAQAALLRRVAETARAATVDAALPPLVNTPEYKLGLDGATTRLLGLTRDEALRVHGAAHLDQAALRDLLQDAETNPSELARRATVALASALCFRHAHAAKALVRAVAPLLKPTLASRREPPLNLLVPGALAPGADDECLRAAGALACLLALGALGDRARQAAKLLDDWLKKAHSWTFRYKAYKDASAKAHDLHARSPSLLTFAGHKCVTNREIFRDALLQLAPMPPKRALGHLVALVTACHAPSLRLELLHFILGLDARWTRDILLGTCELALKHCPDDDTSSSPAPCLSCSPDTFNDPTLSEQ